LPTRNAAKTSAKLTATTTRSPGWIPILGIFCAYVAALLFGREQVPAGLNNDVAAEALRGLYLVEGKHFEVITFSIGNSAETLYLYVLGAMAQLLGPTTLAIQLTSWLVALACIWLIWKLVERITDTIPPWIPVLTAACSLWLFHYARSGLRAICSPFFLAAFTLLLDRAERRPNDRAAGLLCGAVLGLSIYGYTSNRALAIAFVGYAAFRLIRQWKTEVRLARLYSTIALGALVVSIPNLLFFLRQPRDFLFRGSYVLRGGMSDWAVNTMWTVLFPFYYPDVYRHIGGPGFFFDGVSAGLTSSGFSPVPLVFAAAFLVGLWQAGQYIDKPVTAFLLAAWAAAILSLGVAGPSLTRLLIILPVYLVLAALGFGYLIRKRPVLRIPLLLLILYVGVSDGYSYLSGQGEALDYYAAAGTSIGEAANRLAASGQKIVCVVSRDAGVVSYLTHRQLVRVKTVEFYQRMPNPAEIPLDEFRPDTLLVEDAPAFQSLIAQLPKEWPTAKGDRYYVASLSRR
jgi:hypothetical protein